MKERAVLDLRDLPMHGMGSASLTWWGTLGFMLIEGSGFALVIGVYLYLDLSRPNGRSVRHCPTSGRVRS